MGGKMMDNRHDQPNKPREIIYQVGRKKGKIVLGEKNESECVQADTKLVDLLQHSIVSRTLFHHLKSPNDKAVVVLYMLLPVVIFLLTIMLVILLVRI